MGSTIGKIVKVSTGGLIDPLEGSEEAAHQARKAAGQQAAAQQRALDYLKEREALPQQFREEALKRLGGIAGLEGGVGDQQALIERAQASPLYGAIMGGQEAGEEAIMRQAAMTGGLRSGGAQENLAEFSEQLQNRALLESYGQQMAGLQGMAGLPSYAPQIAGGIAGVGQTLAQGRVAGAQAELMGQQQLMSDVMDVGTAAAQAFSDSRLKENVEHIGESNGHQIYRWDWNEQAKELGLDGEGVGVIAEEVEAYMPEAVSEHEGYKYVDYSKLGVH